MEAHRAALEEYTRERAPLEWARTQNSLGVALSDLSWLEGNIERLEEAVAAYESALKERTRKRRPLEWARTQNNLGGALWILGQSGGRHEAPRRGGGGPPRCGGRIYARARAGILGIYAEQSG